MPMDRRDFVKFLGLLAAGTAATPEQVVAFTHYYEVNTPRLSSGLVAVDEVILNGLAKQSMPMGIMLRAGPHRLSLGINAFGGLIRWAAMPHQMLMVPGNSLNFELPYNIFPEDFRAWVGGHISYLDQDQDGLRRYIDVRDVPIVRPRA